MNIEEKIDSINEKINNNQGDLTALQSTLQSQMAKTQHDLAELEKNLERDIEEKMALATDRANLTMIREYMVNKKEEAEQYKNQIAKDMQELKQHSINEKSKFDNLHNQLTEELTNYKLLDSFYPKTRGQVIHSPANRVAAEKGIESYYAKVAQETGKTQAPINPLELFFNKATLLQDFKDSHSGIDVIVSKKLDEIDFNYKGYTIMLCNNCIVDPPAIRNEDRAAVYGAMIDLMMIYAKGNGINHHITIAEPKNNEMYTRLLAERIKTEGLDQTIDGKSAADILSPKPGDAENPGLRHP